ncbi:MAG: division/cell wall cluster transcriptional repressor MraZ [Patescibacteria group bacterium]
MFLGEYVHTIDQKRRLSIPTRLRKELGKEAVVTKGPDHCLFLFPIKTWEAMAEKLSHLPLGQADTRNFVRFMLSGAAESELDNLGRILIPDTLKEYAELGSKAVVVGVFDRIEVWSPERWADVRKHTQDNADRLAERLGELGMY